MNVGAFRFLLLLFLWSEYAWELYIGARQYSKLRNTQELPNKLLQVVFEDILDASRSYNMRCCCLKLILQLFSTLISTIVLSTSFLYVMWDFSNTINPYPSEITTSCVWQVLISTIANLIETPFTLYEQFVLKEPTGFVSHHSIHSFLNVLVADFWRKQLFNVTVSCVIISIIRLSHNHFALWLYLAIGFLSLSLIVSFSLQPVFDESYLLLPKSQLRKDMQALLAEVDFPLDKIYLSSSAGDSRKSITIHGLPSGKQSVVLRDKLIRWRATGRGCTDEEVVGILAHELGHWHHKHTTKMFLLNQLDMLLSLVLFSLMLDEPAMYETVGFTGGEQPVVVGVLVFFGYALRPCHLATDYLMKRASRRFELEADGFAADMGRAADLSSALIQHHRNELVFPVHDGLYSACNHTHPQLVDRLANLERLGRGSST